MNPAEPENDLGTTLRRRADAVPPAGAGTGIDAVLARARRIRRRRRLGGVVGAVVVVAAIAVPVGLLHGGPGTASPVAPAAPSSTRPSTSPSPSSSASATPSPTASLDDLPQGAAPHWAYAAGGAVHLADGSTAQLPDSGTVAAFAPYHGGWLIARQTGQVTSYDGSGGVVAQGSGSLRFAVSTDGTQVGYVLDGRVHAGIGSGMSDGDQSAGVGPHGEPIGFLSSGLLYDRGDGSAPDLAVLGGGIGDRLAALTGSATAADGDLAAGTTASGDGIVVDAGSGRTLWQAGGWTPTAFGSDGRYLAATGGPDDGAVTSVAILDARSGKPVRQAEPATAGVSLVGSPVIDGAGDLLFVGRTGTGSGARYAVLRLSAASGHLDRTSAVVSTPVVLAAGPS